MKNVINTMRIKVETLKSHFRRKTLEIVSEKEGEQLSKVVFQ